MALDPQTLLAHRFAAIRQAYGPRDTILYALGLGLGRDPTDMVDLPYLLETHPDVPPTFAVTLASPGMWIANPAFGVAFAGLVHSAQEAEFLYPLPPAAEIVSVPRIASLTDRGADRGALLTLEREICDAADGRSYCLVRQTLMLRSDGGFGGPPPSEDNAWSLPERSPDCRVSIPISPRAALIYRLSGDWNPLHADPGAARTAGFKRPILHGLATYGMAGMAITRATGCALRRLACRFVGVVYPGDRLDLAIWRSRSTVLFEARVGDHKVLDRGVAEIGSA